MKKLILIFAFVIFYPSLLPTKIYSQVPLFKWAKRAGGTEGEYGRSIAIDGSGNCLITGRFYGIAKFDMITMTSFGGHDIFIAKYDSSGNVLWAKQAGGVGYDESNSIVTDERGNSYIIGYYEGNVTFGTNTLNSAGGKDIFIAKYSSSGNVVWVKRAGGLEDDYGQEISIDGSGNIYLTGYFHGTATFETITLTSQGGSDTFIAKYDSSGSLIWIKQPSSTATDRGYGISTDDSGNSVITGYFEKTITFGNISLTSGGNYPDAFIANYDASGNALWARRAGGTSNVQGSAICINNQGESIVTGIFNETVNFGSSTFTTAGSNDIFIAKYDAMGNLLWAKQLGGSSSDECYDIATSNSNSFIMIGRFGDMVNFGSTRLTCWGGLDIFIFKIDADGNIEWLKQAGGTETDQGYGITTNGFGNSYITGLFSGNAFFDEFTLTCEGTFDIFIAKLNSVGVDTIAPLKPQNLQTIVSSEQAILTWSPNTETDLSYYKIYRSQIQDFVPTHNDSLAIVFSPDTSYIDTNVINGETYYYRISAVDFSGNESEYSEQVTAIPQLTDPNIYLSISSYNFGEVLIDSTKEWQLTIKNMGQNDLIIDNIANNLSTFSANPTSGTITNDDSLKVTLSFTPTEERAYQDTFYISSNDQDNPVVSFPVSGEGTTTLKPSIIIQSTFHDFGDVSVFSSLSWQLMVENKGNADLIVTNISGSNSVFTCSPTQFSLEPSQQQQLAVQFNPNIVQTETGTLTITCNDPDQPEIYVNLAGKGIDDQAPEIIIQLPTEPIWVNTPFQVSAQVTDNYALFSHNVVLNYRTGAETNVHDILMDKQQNDLFQGTIPNSAVTFEGFLYFIDAQDLTDNRTFSDTLSHAIYFNDGDFSTSSSHSYYAAGYPRGQWHMLSVPAVLDETDVSAVLSDEIELGNYGEPNWRLFSYEDTNSDGIKDGYQEYSVDLESSIFRFKIGKAFWLKANPEGGNIEIDVGAGYVLPLESQTISFKPGWNQIGNPFAFPVSFKANNEKIVDQLYYPDGSGGYKLTNIMQPWCGYFAYVNGHDPVDLKVYPKLDNPVSKQLSDTNDLIFPISVYCGNCRDEINYFGINENCCDTRDNKDYPEPPFIGDYISLRFPHHDWDEGCNYFTADIRKNIKNGQIWDVEVITNQQSELVTLQWIVPSEMGNDLNLTLYDVDRNKITDMRTINEYCFSQLRYNEISNFKILAGSRTYVDEQLKDIRSQIPEHFCLNQNYPNPFNSTTMISFELPQAVYVELKLYNMLGEEVALIAKGIYNIGHHKISLDADDLGSGLYLYKLETDSFVDIKKMLVLK
jgi:hypothetical protein